MAKGGRRGDGREQDGNSFHLAENFFAKAITLGTSFEELIERGWLGRSGVREIFTQHGTELRCAVCKVGVEQMRYDHAEKKPPEFEGTVEAMQFKWFDGEPVIAEHFRGASEGGARFLGRGA